MGGSGSHTLRPYKLLAIYSALVVCDWSLLAVGEDRENW